MGSAITNTIRHMVSKVHEYMPRRIDPKKYLSVVVLLLLLLFCRPSWYLNLTFGIFAYNLGFSKSERTDLVIKCDG